MPSEHLLITFPVSDSLLQQVKENFDFESVEYYPSTFVDNGKYRWNHKPPEVPKEVWEKTTVEMTMFHLPDPSQCHNLKLIQGMSAGIEHYLPALQKLKESNSEMRVATASGVHATSIAEHVLMYSLAHFHRLSVLQEIQSDQQWNRTKYITPGQLGGFKELRGQTMGILGYGAIGREVARLASSFGMNIIVASSTGTKKSSDGFTLPNTGDPAGDIPTHWYKSTDSAEFDTFLKKCQVLVISAPLTKSTTALINNSTLSQLSPTSILLNVGRGPIVDHEALMEALESDKLGAAVLDVTDPEPAPPGHALWKTKNLTITPHIAGAGDEYAARCVELLRLNVERVRKGESVVNEVDVTKGY